MSAATIVTLPDPSTARIPKMNFLTKENGLLSWLLTGDHKRIATLYLISITFFFFIGGALAGLIRLELLTPQSDLMAADTYNKVFSMHGLIMVFLFLVPSVPATIGNFVVPMMVGAKDLALPKINLLSWYLYILAGGMMLYTMMAGGVDTGWTFTTPLSTHYLNTHVISAGLAVFVAGFSSIFTGLNFIVTIHKMRCPGMTWFRLPLFIWSNYAASILMVLGTPVLAITLVLVVLERTVHIGVFDPTFGGDPLLFQHLFWFYSHPAVYIMILPGMGVISEVVSTFSRKRVFGYTAVAFSSVAIAVFAFFVWAHHMFIMGISNYAALVFSLLTMLVAVPSAIKIFNWAFTLYKGSITFETPMLYSIGFMGLFTIGGMTGVFPGLDGHGYSPDRDLLCGGALPFRDGGRDVDGVPLGHPLLVAEVDRADVSGKDLAAGGADHVHRLQSHFLPAVHSGHAGHAAALRSVSAGVPGAECLFDRGRDGSGRWLPAADSLPDLVAEVWRHCRRQPVAGDRAGVADAVTAADGELCRDSHYGSRSVRLRVARASAAERGSQCRIARQLPAARRRKSITSIRRTSATTSRRWTSSLTPRTLRCGSFC